jgi:hypothetical protein
MKKFFTLIFFGIMIGGCYTAQQAKADKEKQNAKRKAFTKSHYEFLMILPVESSTLRYEDSNITSSFVIGGKEIDFSIENKTKSPLKLIWDDASLGIFGRSNKVMHSGVKYIDRNSSYPPATILPNTRLDDLVVPTDNVYYSEGYFGQYFSSPGSWQTSNLLLPIGKKNDLSQKMVGQVITLYLPIQNMKNQNMGYTFQFKVTSVVKE